MTTEDTVITRRDGRVGRIEINRPKALNAIDLGMIRVIRAGLDDWAAEPAVHAVVIEGRGGRAFCAGGDIRAIRAHALAGETDDIAAFFREEYALNLAIARYPKPYIALIDGVCMGGGIGLSVHGTVRVATEAALLAMPETAIGFFPDIGATYVLPRLPGELGTYLGLTGARMAGADAVHAGLATHYVPRERLAGLSAALALDGAAALAEYCALPPPFTLAAHRTAIDACFAGASVADILAKLDEEADDWSAQTSATLRTMSPSALVWSLALIRAGAGRTLERCLEAEFEAARRVTMHHEFHEGVRAMLVDKDRAPAWSPARLEDVNPREVEKLVC